MTSQIIRKVNETLLEVGDEFWLNANAESADKSRVYQVISRLRNKGWVIETKVEEDRGVCYIVRKVPDGASAKNDPPQPKPLPRSKKLHTPASPPQPTLPMLGQLLTVTGIGYDPAEPRRQYRLVLTNGLNESWVAILDGAEWNNKPSA